MHGSLVEPAAVATSRRRRLRTFESPTAFSRTCLRLAAVLALVGAIGLLDRVWALCVVVLLLLFAVLARVVDLDGLVADDDLVDEPEPLPEPVLLADEPEPLDEPDPVLAAEPALVPRTFRLPASVGATTVHLVGDVNDWSPTATPMRREGAWFVTTLELEPGRSYRYRYLLDGARWENDWAADAYVPNGFGSDDSLVRT